MTYTKPEMLEVNMSAEVGAYQDDFGDRDEAPIAIPEGESHAASAETA